MNALATDSKNNGNVSLLRSAKFRWSSFAYSAYCRMAPAFIRAGAYS